MSTLSSIDIQGATLKTLECTKNLRYLTSVHLQFNIDCHFEKFCEEFGRIYNHSRRLRDLDLSFYGGGNTLIANTPTHWELPSLVSLRLRAVHHGPLLHPPSICAPQMSQLEMDHVASPIAIQIIKTHLNLVDVEWNVGHIRSPSPTSAPSIFEDASSSSFSSSTPSTATSLWNEMLQNRRPGLQSFSLALVNPMASNIRQLADTWSQLTRLHIAIPLESECVLYILKTCVHLTDLYGLYRSLQSNTRPTVYDEKVVSVVVVVVEAKCLVRLRLEQSDERLWTRLSCPILRSYSQRLPISSDMSFLFAACPRLAYAEFKCGPLFKCSPRDNKNNNNNDTTGNNNNNNNQPTYHNADNNHNDDDGCLLQSRSRYRRGIYVETWNNISSLSSTHFSGLLSWLSPLCVTRVGMHSSTWEHLHDTLIQHRNQLLFLTVLDLRLPIEVTRSYHYVTTTTTTTMVTTEAKKSTPQDDPESSLDAESLGKWIEFIQAFPRLRVIALSHVYQSLPIKALERFLRSIHSPVHIVVPTN